MTPESLHHVKSSLHALPVAVVFSNRLLLTWRETEVDEPSSEQKPASFDERATRMTSLLRAIEGYNHDGLNE